MEQLYMLACTPYSAGTHTLPQGYRFVRFTGSPKDISDWKRIIMEEPAPKDGADSCYHLMIEVYPDIVQTTDIHFIENTVAERVATITTITHADGTGYVHMVKVMSSERGRGLGHCMAEYALREFSRRGATEVLLSTDDFRLPAIKTYLDAGFVPLVHAPQDDPIHHRWDVILEKLSYPSVTRIWREHT